MVLKLIEMGADVNNMLKASKTAYICLGVRGLYQNEMTLWYHAGRHHPSHTYMLGGGGIFICD